MAIIMRCNKHMETQTSQEEGTTIYEAPTEFPTSVRTNSVGFILIGRPRRCNRSKKRIVKDRFMALSTGHQMKSGRGPHYRVGGLDGSAASGRREDSRSAGCGE